MDILLSKGCGNEEKMSVIEKIFGTHSSRELKRIEPLVDKIEALRPTMQALSDEELRGKTEEYKKRLNNGGQWKRWKQRCCWKSRRRRPAWRGQRPSQRP